MAQFPIIILQTDAKSELALHLESEFDAKFVINEKDCLALAESDGYKALVVDLLNKDSLPLNSFESLLKEEVMESLPVVLLSPDGELRNKLEAFQLGFDDVLGSSTSAEEASARINKAIFHAIANEQLKSRLQTANEAAYAAMSDNSDLGSNLQFLVEENNCQNLDELGQLLFRTINHYQLSCSLQMRSVFGVKNMDANGLAKDLESQLLEQLQSAGRFVDFGRRTVINFGQVSLLIRNMPVDDEKRYGSIKDNFPALMQGLDARIKALDARNQLIEEKEAFKKLSANVRDVMVEIDESYQRVMRDIASVVEDMAESIADRIPVLALSLDQEQFFEEVINKCVFDTNKVFNEGLKLDDCFNTLKDSINNSLNNASEIEEQADQQTLDSSSPPENEKPGSKGGIELF